MTVADTRRARRRIIKRYRGPRHFMSVAESIVRERQKAAREAGARKKKT